MESVPNPDSETAAPSPAPRQYTPRFTRKERFEYHARKAPECPLPIPPPVDAVDPRFDRHYRIPILYHEPGQYLIINKPYNVRIDGPLHNCPTIESILMGAFPQYSKIFLAHQLDYVTSGIHIWALSSKATGATGKLFMRRLVKKTYVALIRGHLTTDPFVINKPIATVKGNDKMMCIGTDDNPGRPSETLVTPLQVGYFLHREVTLVQLEPLSGRRHQLRVHLASIGHPIVGDYAYERPDHTNESFRTMLHAWKITIPLVTGTIELETHEPFSQLISGFPSAPGSQVLPELKGPWDLTPREVAWKRHRPGLLTTAWTAAGLTLVAGLTLTCTYLIRRSFRT
ncbi:pseudouridine synthase [Polychytrium aggregatum]|uniref:pseudouridine synthase n=1 Tax=Polychytrium aggregatum TaxID=110093 RepID=UPI0022FDFC82|nr:pseudouridine synthase [Polychytrium aggregatum]KAI9208698.1 pseudouridine synthase [Polychytrium aggregatum]